MTESIPEALAAIKAALAGVPGEPWCVASEPRRVRQISEGGRSVAWCGCYPEELARQFASYIAAVHPARVELLVAELERLQAKDKV